jgi:lysozyme
MATNKMKAGAAAIALTLVTGFEGLRQYAYNDPVGIPTACFGETKGVKLGQHYTIEQCKAMLQSSLDIANTGVDSCTFVYLPDTRRAALVSFTYNVGVANYCNSTLVRKLNAGDVVGACHELPRWTYAKGIQLPGLVKRRAEEMAYCLKGQ